MGTKKQITIFLNTLTFSLTVVARNINMCLARTVFNNVDLCFISLKYQLGCVTQKVVREAASHSISQ